MCIPQTKPGCVCSPHTTLCFSDVTAQCTAPRPPWSHDPGQTLWCHAAVSPPRAWGSGDYARPWCPVCLERGSCCWILSQSVQSSSFPVCWPEHRVVSPGTLSTCLLPVYRAASGNEITDTSATCDTLCTIVWWMHICTLQQWPILFVS